MAAQVTVAKRRTLGGVVVAALCAGGLLAGTASAPLAHAALSTHIGGTDVRVQPDPGCGMSCMIGEMETRTQPDPSCPSGCYEGVGGPATRDPHDLRATIPPDPCHTNRYGGVDSPMSRSAVAFQDAGELSVQLGARRNPVPALNPQPLPPRGDD
jgi:hypothetical protein